VRRTNRPLVERWYQSLVEGNFETGFDMRHDYVVYNLLGNTPVSGRLCHKGKLFV
jgi:hypothetical protein